MGIADKRSQHAYHQLDTDRAGASQSTGDGDGTLRSESCTCSGHPSYSSSYSTLPLSALQYSTTKKNDSPEFSPEIQRPIIYHTYPTSTHSTSSTTTSVSSEIELLALSPTHTHRYPPGIVIIKTTDNRGMDIIEEIHIAGDARQREVRLEWDKLDGTGRDKGAIEKIVDRTVAVFTKKKREWTGSSLENTA